MPCSHWIVTERAAWDSVAVRLFAYLVGTVLVAVLAFWVGSAVFDSTECDGGDCELGTLYGSLWSAGALLLSIAAIVVYEVGRAVGRRHT